MPIQSLTSFSRINHAISFRGNANGNYASLYKPSALDSYGSYRYDQGSVIPDDYLWDIVTHVAKPGDALLELGCNQGNNLLCLARSGYQAYGLDIDQDSLLRAKESARIQRLANQVHLQQWDFAEKGDTPWPDLKGKFKIIYAVHVLSHLSDKALCRAIQGMKEHLAPGGLLVTTILSPRRNPNYPVDVPWLGNRFVYLLARANAVIHGDSRLNAGFFAHSDTTVTQACAGLSPVTAYCRWFEPWESVSWGLPKDRLKWVVFQKPLA